MFSLNLIGVDKNLKKDSVFAEKVTDEKSRINYVLMLSSILDDSDAGESSLQENEDIIKSMFVGGEYKTVVINNNLEPADFRKILYNVILLLKRKSVSFTIALIMKPQNGVRDLYLGHAGMGMCYKINLNDVIRLTPDEKNKKEITAEKLKKGEAFLLCSCEVAESTDNITLIQALSMFGDPEELCKKIIFTSYNKKGTGNHSAAVFVDRDKPVWKRNKKNFARITITLSVLVLLAAVGLVISNFVLNVPTPAEMNSNVTTAAPVNSPPVSINQTPHEVVLPVKPKKAFKEYNSAPVQKISNYLNVSFMVNGSVAMITNWSSVGKEIKYINWEPNKGSKNKIHKYSDYTQIPGSITVIFKDNSTRTFRLNNN